jgi:hypothetical protein
MARRGSGGRLGVWVWVWTGAHEGEGLEVGDDVAQEGELVGLEG